MTLRDAIISCQQNENQDVDLTGAVVSFGEHGNQTLLWLDDGSLRGSSVAVFLEKNSNALPIRTGDIVTAHKVSFMKTEYDTVSCKTVHELRQKGSIDRRFSVTHWGRENQQNISGDMKKRINFLRHWFEELNKDRSCRMTTLSPADCRFCSVAEAVSRIGVTVTVHVQVKRVQVIPEMAIVGRKRAKTTKNVLLVTVEDSTAIATFRDNSLHYQQTMERAFIHQQVYELSHVYTKSIQGTDTVALLPTARTRIVPVRLHALQSTSSRDHSDSCIFSSNITLPMAAWRSQWDDEGTIVIDSGMCNMYCLHEDDSNLSEYLKSSSICQFLTREHTILKEDWEYRDMRVELSKWSQGEVHADSFIIEVLCADVPASILRADIKKQMLVSQLLSALIDTSCPLQWVLKRKAVGRKQIAWQVVSVTKTTL